MGFISVPHDTKVNKLFHWASPLYHMTKIYVINYVFKHCFNELHHLHDSNVHITCTLIIKQDFNVELL